MIINDVNIDYKKC